MGFEQEIWGHDGVVLATVRNNANATWKALQWDVAAASPEVETWPHVLTEGGFVVKLSLNSSLRGGAWQA